MTILCVETDVKYTSPIVGDVAKQVEDCINWLTRHLSARKPHLIKDMGLKSQMCIAAAVLNLGVPEYDEKEGANNVAAELWDKTLNEHRDAVAEMIGYNEIVDELEQDSYNQGFMDCRDQLVAMLNEKGLEELAEEVAKLEIEMEEEQVPEAVTKTE